MATVATLLLGIKADTSQLKKGLKAAQGSFKSLEKTVGLAKKAVVGFVAVQAGRRLLGLATDTAKAADSIGKLSQRLGLSTEFLSEFRFAAERSGIAANTVDLSLQRVTRRFGEIARTGRGTALPALKELGEDLVVAVKHGASFETLLPDIADRLSRTESEAKRLSIAFQLFDSEGAKFVQLLGLGNAEIEKLRKRARELGVTLDTKTVTAAANFNDAMTDLNEAWSTFVRELLTPALPVLTNIINSLTKAADKVKALVAALDLLKKGEFAAAVGVLGADKKPAGPTDDPRFEAFGGIEPQTQGRQLGGSSPTASGTNPLAPLNEGADKAVESLQKVADAMSNLRDKQKEFAEAANEAWTSWLIQARDVISQVKLAALDFTRSFAAGFGQAIANVIVFGQSFGDAMKILFRNLLGQVVATVAKMLIELVIANTIAKAIGLSAHVSRVGQAGQLIFLNVFSSLAAIPVIGPAVAAASTPGIAAAAIAAGAAFGVASAASGFLQLDTGGFIRSEGLAVLHPGEVVATPREVNAALTGGGAGGNMDLTIELDGRQIARRVIRHQPGIFREQGIAR